MYLPNIEDRLTQIQEMGGCFHSYGLNLSVADAVAIIDHAPKSCKFRKGSKYRSNGRTYLNLFMEKPLRTGIDTLLVITVPQD